jgi:hypothetical protein
MDEAVEHARRLEHFVDALRRVGQLFLCEGNTGRERRAQDVSQGMHTARHGQAHTHTQVAGGVGLHARQRRR